MASKYKTVSAPQWRSQDEQVTWAQHAHSSVHLLGRAWSHHEIRHSETASEAVFNHKYHFSVLSVCSLRMHMKIVIAHAKKWSLTLASTYFTRAPTNFTWAQAQVCPSMATPLQHLMISREQFVEQVVFIIHAINSVCAYTCLCWGGSCQKSKWLLE